MLYANLGRKLTKEHKIRISESLKGRIPYNLGINLTEEHKRKISFANKGNNNYFYGKKKHSD